jgi:mRNA guanylyltransferase
LKDGTEVQRYLVFDCVVLDGEILTQKSFDKRIGRFQVFVEKPLRNFLKQNPHVQKLMPFEIVMKIMDKPYALDEMFDHKLPSLPHGNDGLVFTAKSAFYKFGTDEKILKWKPANENSVDFKLQLGAFPLYDPGDGQGPAEDFDARPVINLFIFHGRDDYRKFTELRYNDEDWEKMKGLDQVLDGRIIECYVDDDGYWRFKKEPDGTPRFRDDKPEANHVSTMDKVIKSIKDGVSEKDLRDASGRIKDAWKRRHPEESRDAPPGAQNGR